MVGQVCTAEYIIFLTLLNRLLSYIYLCFVKGFCEETNMHDLDLLTREN